MNCKFEAVKVVLAHFPSGSTEYKVIYPTMNCKFEAVKVDLAHFPSGSTEYKVIYPTMNCKFEAVKVDRLQCMKKTIRELFTKKQRPRPM